MQVHGLHIPELLVTALETGRWPRTSDEANRQNLQPIFSSQGLQQLAPGERHLFLYPPPFATVAEYATGEGTWFWTKYGALDQLDPELAVVLGDFGLGSDATIVLDYRTVPTEPQVLRLVWPDSRQPIHRWEVMSPDFHTFFTVLGL